MDVEPGPVPVDDLAGAGYTRIERDYPAYDGFEHNCFGCSPSNPISMKLVFYGHESRPEVVTRHVVDKNYCGFPLYAHGGIVATLFDELLAYATYHVHGRFGVTKEMTVRYKRPVLVGKTHFLRAAVVSSAPRGDKIDVSVEASIHEGPGPSGNTCATATGTFVILPATMFRNTYTPGE